MNLDDADERSAYAGEYVLGTLTDSERIRFEAALATDARLRGEVAAWQNRLLGLARHAAPAEPSASLWTRIESALPPPDRRVAPERLTARPPTSGVVDPWWRRLFVWQGIAAAAVLASVFFAFVGLRPAVEAPRYLALLQRPSDASTGWIVEAVAGGVVRLVPIAAGDPVPPGRSLQFWTKAETASAPTSLGLVRPATTLSLPASQLPELGERQLFEITLEPEGGSTIGRPTGPILYVGRTLRW